MGGTPDEAFALCRAYPADAMRHVGSGLERGDIPDAGRAPVQKSLGL
jgi:hypothetical protein